MNPFGEAPPEDIVTLEAGAKKVLQMLLEEMMAIDRERAIISFESWMSLIASYPNPRRQDIFHTLEEYLPYRMSEVGEQSVSNALSLEHLT